MATNNPSGSQSNAQSNSQSSASQTASQTGSQSATPSISIPQTAAAGTATITLPPQTATSYYKIASGQQITFGWSLVSVIATPTHLTVSAVCDNANTYPVGPTDGIIDGTATTVVWDVYSYQQNHPNTPLVQGACTLHLWGDQGPEATRSPGYLQPNSALKFALYTPQQYTPLSSGWTCSTCSDAYSSAVAHPAFISIVATFIIVFLSGFHLLRHGR